MKTSAIIIFAFLLFFACKPKEESNASMEVMQIEQDTTIRVNPLLELGCYGYKADGNEIKMSIKELDAEVKADLTYALKEKDKNEGTFVGTFVDNKLIGTYTFMSEGMESTREIAFMVTDNKLFEGFGDLDDSGTKFKDRNNITYSTSMPLSKPGCE